MKIFSESETEHNQYFRKTKFMNFRDFDITQELNFAASTLT